MLKSLTVIRLPKNGKAIEGESEILERPCKGAALAAGEDRDPVTWGLVLIIPGLNLLLHADTETRGIPLHPSQSSAQACQGDVQQKFQLQSLWK